MTILSNIEIGIKAAELLLALDKFRFGCAMYPGYLKNLEALDKVEDWAEELAFRVKADR